MAKKKKKGGKKKRKKKGGSKGSKGGGFSDTASDASVKRYFVDPKPPRKNEYFDFEIDVGEVPYHEQGDEKWNERKRREQRRALKEHVRLAKCTHRWWRTFNTVPIPDWEPDPVSDEDEAAGDAPDLNDGATDPGDGAAGPSDDAPGAEPTEEEKLRQAEASAEATKAIEVPHCILRQDFIEVYLKMAKALYRHTFNEGLSRGYALQDWRKDTGTDPMADEDKEYMTNEQFHASLFELADIWTSSVDVRDYEDFLDKLFRRITTTAKPATPKASRGPSPGPGTPRPALTEEALKVHDSKMEDQEKSPRKFKELKDVKPFEDGEIGGNREESKKQEPPAEEKKDDKGGVEDIDAFLDGLDLGESSGEDEPESKKEDDRDAPYDVTFRLKPEPLVVEPGEPGSEQRAMFEAGFIEDLADAVEADKKRFQIVRFTRREVTDGEFRHFVRVRVLPRETKEEPKAAQLAAKMLELWKNVESELYDGLHTCNIDPEWEPSTRSYQPDEDTAMSDEEPIEFERKDKAAGGHAEMIEAERQAQDLLRDPEGRGLFSVPEGDPVAMRNALRWKPKKKKRAPPPPRPEFGPAEVPSRWKYRTPAPILFDREQWDRARETSKRPSDEDVDVADLVFQFSYIFRKMESEDRRVMVNTITSEPLWMTRDYPNMRRIVAPNTGRETVLNKGPDSDAAPRPRWGRFCVQIIHYMFKKNKISAAQRDVLIRVVEPGMTKTEREQRARRVLMALIERVASARGFNFFDIVAGDKERALKEEADREAQRKQEAELEREAQRTLKQLAGRVSRVISDVPQNATLTPEVKARLDALFMPATPPVPPLSRPGQINEMKRMSMSGGGVRKPIQGGASVASGGGQRSVEASISEKTRKLLQDSLNRPKSFWPTRKNPFPGPPASPAKPGTPNPTRGAKFPSQWGPGRAAGSAVSESGGVALPSLTGSALSLPAPPPEPHTDTWNLAPYAEGRGIVSPLRRDRERFRRIYASANGGAANGGVAGGSRRRISKATADRMMRRVKTKIHVPSTGSEGYDSAATSSRTARKPWQIFDVLGGATAPRDGSRPGSASQNRTNVVFPPIGPSRGNP